MGRGELWENKNGTDHPECNQARQGCRHKVTVETGSTMANQSHP